MELDQCRFTNDERQRMIAKAAYFRSLDRSQQSHPVEDWLAAEKEVEESIQDYCNMRPTQKKMADYQRWGLFNTAIGWWQRFKSRIIN